MSSFIVKVCGVTTPEDAELVVRAGADAVGINFWPGSKRFVGQRAAEIVAAIPHGVLKFGVFVNAPLAEVLQHASRWDLDRIQLHGDELPLDFASISPHQLVRAVRVCDEVSLHETAAWNADMFLFDGASPTSSYGGGGVIAPWSTIASYAAIAVAARARARSRLRPALAFRDSAPTTDLQAGDLSDPPPSQFLAKPFLLAGGLNPGNVAAAIQATRPSGVDVASGVEMALGRKDQRLVEAFVAAARAAAAAAEEEAAADTSAASSLV